MCIVRSIFVKVKKVLEVFVIVVEFYRVVFFYISGIGVKRYNIDLGFVFMVFSYYSVVCKGLDCY